MSKCIFLQSLQVKEQNAIYALSTSLSIEIMAMETLLNALLMFTHIDLLESHEQYVKGSKTQANANFCAPFECKMWRSDLDNAMQYDYLT